MSEKSERIEIFTDGACRGNPGPGGWGAILRSNHHEKTVSGAEKHTTNNRMELMAVIGALTLIKKTSNIAITTDSQYVKNGITKWIHGWKKNGWKTSDRKPVKNSDLWMQLDQLAQSHDISWHWVKGHTGHRENEWADELANQAIDELLR